MFTEDLFRPAVEGLVDSLKKLLNIPKRDTIQE